jgi:hypothetical protein
MVPILLMLSACGACLKESSEPPETEEATERWRSDPPLTPIWNPRITRVLLKVDFTEEAKPFEETIGAIEALLRRSLGPLDRVECAYGEPMTPERLASYIHVRKVYQDSVHHITIRIPQEVVDDRKYLVDLLRTTLGETTVRRTGLDPGHPLGAEDASKMAAAFTFEGTIRQLDYGRLLEDLKPAHVSDGEYVIQLWSDGMSAESGGGSSSWGDQTSAAIRLERQVLESQAVLHITTATLERTTALHEVGHLLGLVSHPAHHRSGHCTNPACIMYPGKMNARTVLANFLTGLVGQPKSSFCGECEADLSAYRLAAGSLGD